MQQLKSLEFSAGNASVPQNNYDNISKLAEISVSTSASTSNTQDVQTAPYRPVPEPKIASHHPHCGPSPMPLNRHLDLDSSQAHLHHSCPALDASLSVSIVQPKSCPSSVAVSPKCSQLSPNNSSNLPRTSQNSHTGFNGSSSSSSSNSRPVKAPPLL